MSFRLSVLWLCVSGNSVLMLYIGWYLCMLLISHSRFSLGVTCDFSKQGLVYVLHYPDSLGSIFAISQATYFCSKHGV